MCGDAEQGRMMGKRTKPEINWLQNHVVRGDRLLVCILQPSFCSIVTLFQHVVHILLNRFSQIKHSSLRRVTFIDQVSVTFQSFQVYFLRLNF